MVLNTRIMADLGAIATIIAAIVAAANTAFISIYLTYEKRKSEKQHFRKIWLIDNASTSAYDRIFVI
jgi:ribosomal protein L20